MFLVKKAYAIQSVSVNNFGVKNSIGVVATIQDAFIWFINLLIYLGWILTVIGIALSIYKLIYEKYLNAEVGEANMTAFAQAVSKSVLILVAGIILLCGGFVLEVVATFVGSNATLSVPVQLR